MVDMKKILLGFMTLLMLTPVLACGMAFCPTMASAAEDQPCHESGDMGESSAPMLAIDCMGVDLFQADVSNDLQLNLSVDSVGYAWADLITEHNFQSNNINSIRGPPDRPPNAEPSIILTTQPKSMRKKKKP